MTEETKRIILYSAIAVFVCAVLAGVGWWFYKQSLYAVFDSQKDGFRISYPKDWKRVDHPNPGAIVSFVSPKEGVLDRFQENISLTMTDLSKTPLTMEQYSKLTVEQMKAVFVGTKLLESFPVRLSGHAGYKFVFQDVAKNPTTLVVYAFLSHDIAYNITYVGIGERYNKDKRIIQDVIDSLKVYF